jgi:hypothetical protein
MLLSIQTRTQQYNEPYRTVMFPVRPLTHSPAHPLKDQPQKVDMILTGCNQALVSSMRTEEEYSSLRLDYLKSSGLWHTHKHTHASFVGPSTHLNTSLTLQQWSSTFCQSRSFSESKCKPRSNALVCFNLTQKNKPMQHEPIKTVL